MRRTIRRTTVAGLAVATLALTSACGSSNASGDDAKDTNTEGSGVSTGLAPGSKVEATDAKDLMTSVVDAMTSMKISADMSAGSAGTMHMEGVEQTKPSVLAEMKMTISGTDEDIRMVGSDIYVHMPASSGLPGGKSWLSMNMSDIGSITGVDTSAMGQAMTDPTSSISKYAKYITGGTYVGSEKVDGVSAKHYTFTVDLKSGMAAMMPSGVPSSVAGQVPSSATEDIWIDGDSHPVQIKLEMGKLGTTTMHMSDFGTKVSVSAPPAAQVADMKQLMGQLGSSGS